MPSASTKPKMAPRRNILLRTPIPTVLATPEQAAWFAEQVAKFDSLGRELALHLDEAEALRVEWQDFHDGNPACSHDHSTKCRSQECGRLWHVYLDSSEEADVPNRSREALYREIEGMVIEILEGVGVKPPFDLDAMIGLQCRPMGIVEAGPRKFLLFGSQSFPDDLYGSGDWPDHEVLFL
jgi:hypothetical protein